MLGIIRRYLRMPRFFSFFSRRPTINSGLTKLEILAMRNKKRDSNGTEGISNLNVEKGKKKYERREVRNKGRKVEKFLNFQNILKIVCISSSHNLVNIYRKIQRKSRNKKRNI